MIIPFTVFNCSYCFLSPDFNVFLKLFANDSVILSGITSDLIFLVEAKMSSHFVISCSFGINSLSGFNALYSLFLYIMFLFHLFY